MQPYLQKSKSKNNRSYLNSNTDSSESEQDQDELIKQIIQKRKTLIADSNQRLNTKDIVN